MVLVLFWHRFLFVWYGSGIVLVWFWRMALVWYVVACVVGMVFRIAFGMVLVRFEHGLGRVSVGFRCAFVVIFDLVFI